MRELNVRPIKKVSEFFISRESDVIDFFKRKSFYLHVQAKWVVDGREENVHGSYHRGV